ncbi:putative oxidoreductase YfjR [Reticulibacter mediterranei]|uniref:Putative oxidoreductase YfjR n=1 Tax=Reticulibacter mediterranei TaxID=2778369 RepID=A0A8J3N6Y7_9CHLR|nr:NAD(P)-dependent oxidoreductase [Reticulibacter mediterranei]GHP00883.1 putative oxidoreductase YfjR [Reticulibacter mediterranei]
MTSPLPVLASNTIGFVGLGKMGFPIAQHLLTAGFHMRAYDLDPQRAASLAQFGAEQREQLQEVVEPGGIVFSMVPDDVALIHIVEGKDGILAHLGPGGVHVSMSTIAPSLAEQFEHRYAQRGATYLSAPVLGRPNLAQAGQLTVLLSGQPTVWERVRLMLSHVGSIHEVGDRAEIACVLKLLNNFLIISALEAMGEASGILECYRIDSRQFFTIVADGIFDCPVYQEYGNMIGTGTFEPALFPTMLGMKDVLLIEAMAERLGLHLPTLQLAKQHLRDAMDAGWHQMDWSILAAFASKDVRQPTFHLSDKKEVE